MTLMMTAASMSSVANEIAASAEYINSKRILQCYRCQAFGHTSANCFKTPRCVKCAQSHLTSECAKTPDTPAKCCNCSGDHPASYTQCPAYLKYQERRSLATIRDNSNILNTRNKNLQTNNTHTPSENRNIVNMRVSSDINQLTLSATKSVNKLKFSQTQPSRSYAETTSNINTTVNDDLSDINGLISEITKLKQLIDIPHMILVIRNLNNKLFNAKDGMEKIQAFIEATELLDRNG